MQGKIILITFAVVVFILSLASAFVGPTHIGKVPGPPPIVKPEKPEVTLVLDFGEEDIATVSTTANTVYEALKNVSDVEGIPVKTKKYDFGVLIESIRDLPNTKKRAWIYFVNGKARAVAADKYELTTGDKVEWRYIEPKEE